MEQYDSFTSNDELHITTGVHTTILEVGEIIQKLFLKIGKEVF